MSEPQSHSKKDFVQGKYNRRSWLRSFLRHDSGGVAILLAGSIVPIVAVAGIALDFGRATHVRMQLQAAADAAAMAGSVAQDRSVAGRRAAAEHAFDINSANIKNGVAIQKTATPVPGSITVTSSADVPTVFMKVLNYTSVQVNATSTVQSGGKKLELAIVLDTTGSMNNNNKLAQLKAAVPSILNIVMPTGHTDTRVSLVPFATYINVGATNPQLLTGRTDLPDKQCVVERKRGTRPNEDAPTLNSDEFWALTNNASCQSTKAITPLTADRAVLDAAINNLTASGATSGHLGIQWGWHTISPLWSGRWPAASTPVAYTDKDTIKALVILTDGNFTELHLEEDGSSPGCNGSSDCPASRVEGKAYCDAIKSKLDANGQEAVMVFTIGFSLDPEDTDAGLKARDTMKYCASFDKNDPEPDPLLRKKHFYFPVTEQDLQSAFNAIGDAVAEAITKPRYTN